MSRRALIFDFGNVVAHFDYAKACETYGRALGITGEEFLARLRRAGFSELVRRYERGGMSAPEFSRSVCALIGLEIGHDEFATAWSDIFTLNEPVARLVEQLAGRGYTLVLGSNTNDLHAAHFRRQFAATLAHFRRLVLSYEVGHIKPDAAFYRACAEAAGEPPARCIFIDDLPENVAGATAAGLHGVVFRDVPTLAADLRSLGVDVPPEAA